MEHYNFSEIQPNENFDHLEFNKQLYIKYIELHRDSVKYVWNELKQILEDEMSYSTKVISQTNKLIKNHDKSKYSLGEFDGYRQWYYPTHHELSTITPKNREKYFKKSQDTHRKNNPHHMSYWVQGGRPKKMLPQYVLEMLCDWTAGVWMDKTSDSVTHFFSKIASRPIHEDTYFMIKSLLPVMDVILEDIKEGTND